MDFWLTQGKYTNEFETKLSNFLNVKYFSFVNSGSLANLLAFMALTSPLLGERSIKREDEVITVVACFPTTVAPIVQFGVVPVFVDLTIPQYNIDNEDKYTGTIGDIGTSSFYPPHYNWRGRRSLYR